MEKSKLLFKKDLSEPLLDFWVGGNFLSLKLMIHLNMTDLTM